MTPPNDRRRLPFVIASAVVLIAGAIALSLAVTRAGATTRSAATPTPSPTPPPYTIPFADCAGATFGPALAPLNEPDHHLHRGTRHDHRHRRVVRGDNHHQRGDHPGLPAAQPGAAVGQQLRDPGPQSLLRRCPLLAHRPEHVDPDVIQGGDPNCIGNIGAAPATPTGSCGSGGPGYSFNDEQVHEQYVAGVIAMANSGVGTNSNGSQFFITKSDETSIWPLNNKGLAYNLFGKVADSASLAVVDKIVQGDVMQTVTVAEQT